MARSKAVRSTGNVFEDLGVSQPAEALAKSELAILITKAVKASGLTQVAAGRLLGIDQPKVSELLRGRLTQFSTERLLSFLTRLGRDIDIVVREPARADRRSTGHIHVRAMRMRRPRNEEAGITEQADRGP